jgi:hypothetical protein
LPRHIEAALTTIREIVHLVERGLHRDRQHEALPATPQAGQNHPRPALPNSETKPANDPHDW